MAAVQDGLTFDSNIPQGYGVGSSGALCAAVYEQYLASAESIGDVVRARAEVAQMEGYFHGRSSGMDPLVSLSGVPVLKEMGSYQLLAPLKWPQDLRVFLLDTGVGRKTGRLVQTYLDLSTHESFQQSCIRPLVQHADHAISFLIYFHLFAFWQHLQVVSQLQMQYFTPMIPASVLDLWGATLAENEICMKHCGAGGGGFFLGFSTSDSALIAFQEKCPFRVITLY
jgi:mevalonate kinase